MTFARLLALEATAALFSLLVHVQTGLMLGIVEAPVEDHSTASVDLNRLTELQDTVLEQMVAELPHFFDSVHDVVKGALRDQDIRQRHDPAQLRAWLRRLHARCADIVAPTLLDRAARVVEQVSENRLLLVVPDCLQAPPSRKAFGTILRRGWQHVSSTICHALIERPEIPLLSIMPAAASIALSPQDSAHAVRMAAQDEAALALMQTVRDSVVTAMARGGGLRVD
ncbi:uncharacterized protein MONBRDRAFT_21829 [Monosiga brevicollis MX1]|uniref:Uncharacterized protein n=1 Tax=Monosiga brevicollis TaxID=81824 RepID=A9UNQ8_MONBE|nr:uncharacterized protein MONBRDRAFT_21829 [Monosiga brevicollis MX1]EDQ92287.1 predicted protein [Monosiga brevicollis MX1]|eukprot:XP_001742049.1 hypothetical protein [Monosiga brevicollis MX1]